MLFLFTTQRHAIIILNIRIIMSSLPVHERTKSARQVAFSYTPYYKYRRGVI